MGYRSAVTVVVYGDRRRLETLAALMLAKHHNPNHSNKHNGNWDTKHWLSHVVFDDNFDNMNYDRRKYAEWDGGKQAGFQAEFDDIKWYDDCDAWFDDLREMVDEMNKEVEEDALVVCCEMLRFGEDSTDTEYRASDVVLDNGQYMLEWRRVMDPTLIDHYEKEKSNENNSSREPAPHQAQQEDRREPASADS